MYNNKIFTKVTNLKIHTLLSHLMTIFKFQNSNKSIFCRKFFINFSNILNYLFFLLIVLLRNLQIYTFHFKKFEDFFDKCPIKFKLFNSRKIKSNTSIEAKRVY